MATTEASNSSTASPAQLDLDDDEQANGVQHDGDGQAVPLTKKQLENRKKRERLKAKKQQHNGGAAVSPLPTSSTNGIEQSSNEIDNLTSTFNNLTIHKYFTDHTPGSRLTSSNTPAGRYPIATKPLKAGTTLFTASPYAAVVSDQFVTNICHQCFTRQSPTLYVCQDCRVFRFCSTACKNAAASVHELECKALSRLGSIRIQGHHTTIRALIRILHQRLLDVQRIERLSDRLEKASKKRQVNSTKTLGDVPGHNRHELAALVSHLNQIDAQTLLQTKVVLEKLQQIVDPRAWQGVNDAVQIYFQLRFNAHQITDETQSDQLGVGLYLPAAFMNHSCNPTCVYYYDYGQTAADCQMVMRLVRDVEVGEQLTFSYANLYEPRPVRHAHLRSTYMIDQCLCSRCAVPYDQSPDRYLDAYRCQACFEKNRPDVQVLAGLSATQPTVTCLQCGTITKFDDLQPVVNTAVAMFDAGMQSLSQTQQARPAVDILTDKVYDVLVPILHPYNVKLYNTHSILIQLNEALSRPKKSLEYANENMQALRTFNLGNHPQAADLYRQIGRAHQQLWRERSSSREDGSTNTTKSNATANGSANTSENDSLYKQACEAYAQAIDVRSVCRGSTHYTTKEIKREVQELNEVTKQTEHTTTKKKR